MRFVIVCYGSFSTKNIIQYISYIENSTYEIVKQNDKPKSDYDLIILSGSKEHVYDNTFELDSWIIQSEKRVLAICFGMQLVAYHFGSEIFKKKKLEKQLSEIYEKRNGVVTIEKKWMNRYDYIKNVPKGFYLTGVNKKNEIISFTNHKKWWCVQYHPENEKSYDFELLFFLIQQIKK
jgi:GMP synthase (glutamine-hydrolysing)